MATESAFADLPETSAEPWPSSIAAAAPSAAVDEPKTAQFAGVAEAHPLAAAAMACIDRVMDEGHPLVCAFSSGKDSSVVVGMTLHVAALRAAEDRPVPRLLVIHSDTGVESPEVRRLADSELDKMVQFAGLHGLPLEVRVGKPQLYTSWAVRVIGGRALPSFPTSHRDCSVNWKVDVGNRLTKEAFADLLDSPDEAQPVLMTGVRLGESATRAAGIVSRGEQAEEIWFSPEGQPRLSPIIHWSSDDVFEYLGYANAGVIPTYSDFGDTMQFYRDAGGSSCAVIGDMKMAADVAKEKGGCGARSGCWTCVRVQKDTSLETMITSDLERYGYMRGLNKLRNFIANTQYDWDRRTFLGRTIDDNGDVAVTADVYSPSMLEELLRYSLTLQLREQVAAARKGIKPRFNVIGTRELIAIDALWSLYGLHKPFHAIKIYHEVYGGHLSDVPNVPMVPRSPVPKYGKLQVGHAWNDDIKSGDPKRDRMLSGGINSPVHQMVSESCGDAGFGIKQTALGDYVVAWDTVGSFEVDEQGAEDWITFFSDEKIEEHHDADIDRTVAVREYLSMGFLTPGHASVLRWHEIARRTQWMQRHGLVGDVQRSRLIAMMDMSAAGRDPFHVDAEKELAARQAGTWVSGAYEARPALEVNEHGFVAAEEPTDSAFIGLLDGAYQQDLFADLPPTHGATDQGWSERGDRAQ